MVNMLMKLGLYLLRFRTPKISLNLVTLMLAPKTLSKYTNLREK